MGYYECLSADKEYKKKDQQMFMIDVSLYDKHKTIYSKSDTIFGELKFKD